jgi:hypothetical protein
MDMKIERDFLKCVKATFDFDFQSPNLVYGLWADLSLAYTNAEWFRFAKENNGEHILDTWCLGKNILDATPDVLLSFYKTLYSKGLESRHPIEHIFNCSSPRVERKLLMRILPLREGEGLLVETSTIVEIPHVLSLYVSEQYVDENGIITQCSNCRRVRKTDGSSQWGFIKELMEKSHPNISHGLCSTCLEWYYPASICAA